MDEKLGNTSKEGDTVEIIEIKVIYNEEVDHKSDKICMYLPLSNEKLIKLQKKGAQV